ncbi:MAG: hypothetical protein WCA39_06355 [Nitrososphaeraceae archaeon]
MSKRKKAYILYLIVISGIVAILFALGVINITEFSTELAVGLLLAIPSIIFSYSLTTIRIVYTQTKYIKKAQKIIDQNNLN